MALGGIAEFGDGLRCVDICGVSAISSEKINLFANIRTEDFALKTEITYKIEIQNTDTCKRTSMNSSRGKVLTSMNRLRPCHSSTTPTSQSALPSFHSPFPSTHSAIVCIIIVASEIPNPAPPSSSGSAIPIHPSFAKAPWSS